MVHFAMTPDYVILFEVLPGKCLVAAVAPPCAIFNRIDRKCQVLQKRLCAMFGLREVSDASIPVLVRLTIAIS